MAEIPIDRLRANPANIRRALGDLDELAASIRSTGGTLLQPLVVSPLPDGGFELVDGHRRLEAAKRLGLKTLPCIAAPKGDQEQKIATMLAAAMHKQLTPLELADAFQSLRNRGLTVAEIARRTGYSTSTVSSRLLLLTLPRETRDRVQHKEISVADAERMARDLRDNKTGSAVLGPKATWFGPKHRLAQAVVERCEHIETRRKVGGAGCGQCWEEIIRADERAGGQAVTQ